MIVLANRLYLLTPTFPPKKKPIKTVLLLSLKKIIVPKENFIQVLLVFQDSSELILECFHRNSMINYIKKMADRKVKIVTIKKSSLLVSKPKSKGEEFTLVNPFSNPLVQKMARTGGRMGYIMLSFSGDRYEYFLGLLTNFGVLALETQDSFQIADFIFIIGNTIEDVYENDIHAIDVVSEIENTSVRIAFSSALEKHGWVTEIVRLQSSLRNE